MNNDIEYENRQIIPRWLPFNENNRIFIDSKFFSEPITDEEKFNLEALKSDWLRNRSTTFAQELVSSAKTLGLEGDSIINDTITFLHNDKTPQNIFFPFQLNIKSNKLENCEYDDSNINDSIHNIRNELRAELADPILWVDLAYYHLLAGNNIKAEKCIKTALTLDSTNYFILRSASRFFVHNDDPEQALRILNGAILSSKHPLIISSEIAIAEAFGIRSKKIKHGFEIQNNQNISPRLLTELQATLATLEYNNGSGKIGKKLLQKALILPNENSLAQIEFINNRFDGRFDTRMYKLPYQYEANTWNSYRNSDYKEALVQSKSWFNYQPLSSRPALLHSHINLLIFENYTDSIDLLDKALVITPSDPFLLNNKAVALAKSNQVEKALDIINKIIIDPDDEDYDIITATRGLVAFRQGKIDIGNQYYLEAIEDLRKKNNIPRVARALYYWGIELIRTGDENGRKFINEAYNLAKKSNQNELMFIIEEKRLTISST